MLHLILVDTAIELIPEVISHRPSVLANIQKFGNAGKILDTTLHHTDMHDLPNYEARGRPDILHQFLLASLGSPANLLTQLKIYFHANSKLYQIDSEMRCPKDIQRFKALMAQLLELSHIPKDPPYFIHQISNNFSSWINERFATPNILCFTRQGNPSTFASLCHETSWHSTDVVAFIGGFQKGYFSPEIEKIPSKKVQLGNIGLESAIVVQRVIAAYEYGLKQL
jgi:rRNA small subunit pseudouridine methyltransferase Nep1